MAITARTLMAGLAFTCTLFTAGQAPAAQDELAALVLHVDNYARVSPEHLERSKLEVTRIYKAAGIQTAWVESDGPADASRRQPDARPDAMHLRVLLLCQDMTARKIEADAIPANVLGRAAGPTARAYILTPRVANLATRRHLDFDRLLGRVIAHEVGHLLLPPRSHSASGIMRESLDTRSTRNATFTEAQRKKMLAVLQVPQDPS